MTTASVLPKVAHAMAQQLKRVNENPERLKERIAELEAEVERLTHLLNAQNTDRLPVAPSGWEQIGDRHYRLNGRDAGTQKALAERLRVGQDRVCKWIGQRRLETVVTPDGHESVWLDQGKPSRKKKVQKARP